MESIVQSILVWLTIPAVGLPAVFVVSLVSATLIPVGSEPALFGYIKLNPDMFWVAIMVATLGNTIGGVIDWLMGYGAKSGYEKLVSNHEATLLGWFRRLGPRALLLSWLPVVGDPLCAVAGWLKLPFWPCVFYMAVGKFLRYVTLTYALWLIPDEFWSGLWQSLMTILGGWFN